MSEANKSTTNIPSIYDLIIIGAGPAGLTASIYASRYKLSNLVIGKQLGGELALAHNVCNYPGFISIPGLELCEKFKEQVEVLGAKVLLKEVGKIEMVECASSNTNFSSVSKLALTASATNNKTQNKNRIQTVHRGRRRLAQTEADIQKNCTALSFQVYIDKDEVYEAKALIIATGSERRKLNVPGEKEYTGKGVSYCVTCDAPFFKDKTVALIGGSDSAVTGAIKMSEYAKKVYIIYRKDKLRAESSWIEEWKKIEASGKGETIYETNVTEILGDKTNVIGVKLDKRNKRDMGDNILKVDGVFIEIGGVPGTSLVQNLGVKIDDSGHVIVNDEMAVNIPGIFCAGDMTDKSKIMKQAITAGAQGAIAASSAYKFIKKESAPQILGV